MAGIFAFMKTLDPSSVVREAEFDAAAWSAWQLEKWKNMRDRFEEGKLLTPKQSEEFKEIAKWFIQERATLYDMKYQDLRNAYDAFWIPDDLLPTNASEALKEKIQWETQPTTEETVWYFTEWPASVGTTWNEDRDAIINLF